MCIMLWLSHVAAPDLKLVTGAQAEFVSSIFFPMLSFFRAKYAEYAVGCHLWTRAGPVQGLLQPFASHLALHVASDSSSALPGQTALCSYDSKAWVPWTTAQINFQSLKSDSVKKDAEFVRSNHGQPHSTQLTWSHTHSTRRPRRKIHLASAYTAFCDVKHEQSTS